MRKIQIEKEFIYGAVRRILGVVCLVCMATVGAMGQDEVSTPAQFPGGGKALFEYLGDELQYPKAAFEQGIEGRVICQFHVETDGSITEPHVVRTSGDSTLDQEAVRALNTMPKWIPATQMGEPIRSIYTVPINFKKPKETPTAQTGDSTRAYAVVEQMPQFPGGQEAMFRYISTRLLYSPSINMQDIDGTTICSMVIAADGSVTNVAVARSCGNTELDEVAVKVICSMPKWEPGQSRGKAVPVRYAIPVTFKGKYECEAPKGEVPPEYPGGERFLFAYMRLNIQYPAEAARNGWYGRAVCKFVIDVDGSIRDVEIEESTGHKCLDEEAIRVVANMPKWYPGRKDGVPIPVTFHIPVNFQTDESMRQTTKDDGNDYLIQPKAKKNKKKAAPKGGNEELKMKN